MSFGDYSILFQKHSSFTFGYDKYLTYYNQQNVGLVESKKGPSFPEGNGVLKNSLTPLIFWILHIALETPLQIVFKRNPGTFRDVACPRLECPEV